MDPSSDRSAAYELLNNGTLLLFDVIDTSVEESVGGDEALVEIQIQLRDEDDEDREDGDDVESVAWGAFGFIFVLATLSFADARPRGYSEKEFVADDEFTVADLLAHLRFERGELHFSVDYLRGRCAKTDVVVRRNGRVTLTTRCRGEAPLRWIDRLKGKKVLERIS
ncbi:MAG: hypothetical protein IT384_07975 [Deltaproteobacteria bacterium]|nr:hypothetical protein [Deltaproteobacteria bacterium]